MIILIGGVLAALLFAGCGMLYSHADKRLSIWLFFSGGVVSLFVACKTWSDLVSIPSATLQPVTSIEDEVNYYSKTAQARSWLPPQLPDDFTQKGAQVTLNFGGAITRWPAQFGRDAPDRPAPIILPGGRIVIPYVENQRIYVKTQNMFGDPDQSVVMNNEWPVRLRAGWDKNFNENSFEVVDESHLPVFQIRYLAPDSIEVRGIFVAPNGAVTVAFDNGLTGVAPGQKLPPIPSRKAWFKYPSEHFQGILNH